MRYDLFIGIDVGKSGAVSFLSAEGDISAFKMPEHLDVREFVKILKDNSEGMKPFVLIEKVNARPEDSSRSAFTFGRYVQMAHDAVIAAGLPYDEIAPKAWQKKFSVPKLDYSSRKRWLKVKAASIFPDAKPPTLWSCDAMLIAEHCYRNYKSEK